MSEPERETVPRTFMGLYCPECGAMAYTSTIETMEADRGRRRWAIEIDHHGCDTDGCKHNHRTGEPWGTGLPYAT